ncbi:phage integrase N-terminal SAM-like domain-containing protein [Xanthomonas campestris]|uniref:phage integrase N-terminal SAM-like domain-containing protein n=1 Tax=Xanthomonas campestris TaxID=339 RepID=UPI002B1CC738|nr:phage integrase N-terminal SAM-like domain-containing protein [Xanthomonas campestris]
MRRYPALTQAYEIHPKNSGVTAPPPLRLLDQARDRLRVRHYSLRTEQASLSWIRRFILASGKCHPTRTGQVQNLA